MYILQGTLPRLARLHLPSLESSSISSISKLRCSRHQFFPSQARQMSFLFDSLMSRLPRDMPAPSTCFLAALSLPFSPQALRPRTSICQDDTSRTVVSTIDPPQFLSPPENTTSYFPIVSILISMPAQSCDQGTAPQRFCPKMRRQPCKPNLALL